MYPEIYTQINQDSELRRRLSSVSTVLLDTGGRAGPPTEPIITTLTQLSGVASIIPCTARTTTEERDAVALQSLQDMFTDGVYEAGVVVVSAGQEYVLGDARRWEQVRTITSLLSRLIIPIGIPDTDNPYAVIPTGGDQALWGFPQSMIGASYISEKGVPLALPSYPGQQSLVIWPSGSATACPRERDFYQIVSVLDGMMLANSKLFEGLDIMIGNESIIIRPLADDGTPITKQTGVRLLERLGRLDGRCTLFVGDDDTTDLEAAQYVKQRGGLVVTTMHAGEQLQSLADIRCAETAGLGIEAVLRSLIAIRESGTPMPANEKKRSLWPMGNLAQYMSDERLIVPPGVALASSAPEGARKKFLQIAQGNFHYGVALAIPEEVARGGKVFAPMVFINEQAYGYPDDLFTGIEDLIVFGDLELIDFILSESPIRMLAEDASNLFIFPGNGGQYLRNVLEARGIKPENVLSVAAKRHLDAEKPWCEVELPMKTEPITTQLEQARRLVFVDDTISTGSTLDAVLREMDFCWRWSPEGITIIVESLGAAREKDALMAALRPFVGRLQIFAPIFYAGTAQRPRLLTTGSAVDGITNPARFNAKNYPRELVDALLSKIT